jgi:hypothetical protein
MSGGATPARCVLSAVYSLSNWDCYLDKFIFRPVVFSPRQTDGGDIGSVQQMPAPLSPAFSLSRMNSGRNEHGMRPAIANTGDFATLAKRQYDRGTCVGEGRELLV